VREDILPRITRDGRFVLAWTAAAAQDASRCSVFAADTGTLAATVPLNPDIEDPCILEPNLYYAVGRSLTAIDLASGAVIWTWQAPAAQFKGPPPLRR
jgi:hypothetical protein